MPKFILYEEGEEKEITQTEKLFPFLFEKGHIVSLVGAGGKTSLLYYFAKTAGQYLKRVTATTTTHIEMPKEQHIYAESLADAEKIWNENTYIVTGTATGKKLSSLEDIQLHTFIQNSNFTCIEADGSKNFPCKVPREGEPVILPECDTVVAVLGLSAIGKPLEEVCFRKELAMKLLAADEKHKMNENDFALILSSELGLMKNVDKRNYIIILNQCDGALEHNSAKKIADLLSKKGYFRVISCYMDEAERNDR